MEGVARYAKEHHWILDCEMGWTHHLPRNWKGDGIIVHANQDPAIIDFVKGTKACVVDISAVDDSFQAHKVIISNEAIAEHAVRHLSELGFEEFGCVDASTHPGDQLRHRLFAEEVSKIGGRFHLVPLGNLTEQLARLPKPMALLTTKDQFAIETIRICQSAGYSVPEDLAVVGINDTPILCDLAEVPLTSVDPNFQENGYQAAALLDQLLNKKKPPKTPIIIPPKGITLRRSSDTLFIPDRDTARALRFLRDHYLSLNSIAEVAAEGTTPLRKIQTLFRQFTGYTMAQELSRLKVEHSKRLLLNPKAKIEVIARESGFSSRTYFVRAFRGFTGMSPKAYRKQAQSL